MKWKYKNGIFVFFFFFFSFLLFPLFSFVFLHSFFQNVKSVKILILGSSVSRRYENLLQKPLIFCRFIRAISVFCAKLRHACVYFSTFVCSNAKCRSQSCNWSFILEKSSHGLWPHGKFFESDLYKMNQIFFFWSVFTEKIKICIKHHRLHLYQTWKWL